MHSSLERGAPKDRGTFLGEPDLGIATQREVEGSPAIDASFRPDRATVAMDDALDRRQTHAGTRELRLRMKSLKRCEEPGGVVTINAGAVVAYEERLAARASVVDPTSIRAREALEEYFQAFESMPQRKNHAWLRSQSAANSVGERRQNLSAIGEVRGPPDVAKASDPRRMVRHTSRRAARA